MMPTRLTRTLASYGLGFSFILSLLLIPSAALAATPNWSGSLVALPPVLDPFDSEGQPSVAGYEATIINPGPSTVSQLFLSVVFSQPYEAATPKDTGDAPLFVQIQKNGAEVNLELACGQDVYDAPLNCDLGALAAGGDASVTVAYQTDGSDDDAGVTVRWESVGTGSGPGDNSRGDVLGLIFDDNTLTTDILPPTQMSADGLNYSGQFLLEDGVVVDNAPINGRSNQAQTIVHSPAEFIAVTVEDGEGVDQTCPTGYTGCVLQASEIHVGDGSNAYGLFKVEVIFDKTILVGVNFKKLTVLHVLDDGSVQEIPQSRSCSGTVICVMSESQSGGHAKFTMYFDQNGFVKYH
jgi:hypothetical protein